MHLIAILQSMYAKVVLDEKMERMGNSILGFSLPMHYEYHLAE